MKLLKKIILCLVFILGTLSYSNTVFAGLSYYAYDEAKRYADPGILWYPVTYAEEYDHVSIKDFLNVGSSNITNENGPTVHVYPTTGAVVTYRDSIRAIVKIANSPGPFYYSINDSNPENMTAKIASGNMINLNTSGSAGNKTFTVYVKDKLGGVGSATIIIRKKDSTNPQL
ncbi:hypothetical protein [Desulforamulus aquiferis]|uniref:Uncharacterized protein n=1 Tax=Desulforamulus aquiferis TaxID=1397668 RepID=A0AAW7Z778_9FIRM|nr:hypothetical protein [Desulforamulus aquiferis]MDO7785807.1 hypothetical protein [Desulforamulus aquiferis]